MKLKVVIFHNQPPVTFCLCFLHFSRAGKGVFSAMKLGKIKMSKDDHKNRGKGIAIKKTIKQNKVILLLLLLKISPL